MRKKNQMEINGEERRGLVWERDWWTGGEKAGDEMERRRRWRGEKKGKETRWWPVCWNDDEVRVGEWCTERGK
jgi:hypothetical protein